MSNVRAETRELYERDRRPDGFGILPTICREPWDGDVHGTSHELGFTFERELLDATGSMEV